MFVVVVETIQATATPMCFCDDDEDDTTKLITMMTVVDQFIQN